jgi:hypothetical protein
MSFKIDLYDCLVKSAQTGLTMQKKDGCFPEGYDGPWRHKATPVRATAHWALLLYRAYELTGNGIFLDAAMRGCDYLTKKENRPFGYTFYCRRGTLVNDQCNGLIGQAWAVEPLIVIGQRSDNKKYLNIAREVLALHRYSFEHHAWCTVDIDGKEIGINRNLNQQVWFSAMALVLGRFLGDDYLLKRSRDFFAHIPSLIEFVDSGLMKHIFRVRGGARMWLGDWRRIIQALVQRFDKIRVPILVGKRVVALSLGYLTFILYGFALAYRYCNDEPFWHDPALRRILLTSIRYVESHFPYGYLEEGGFRWGYNPVGIEMAFVLETFNSLLDLDSSSRGITKWLQKQFEGYYDFDADLLCKNTYDSITLAARLYEATRSENYALGIRD